MSFLDNIKIVGSKMDEFEQAKKEHDALLQRQKEEKEEKMAAAEAKRKSTGKKMTNSVVVKEDRKARWESAKTSRDSTSVRNKGTSSRQTAITSQQTFSVTVTSKNTAFLMTKGSGLNTPQGSTARKKKSVRPSSLQGLPRRDDGDDSSEDKRQIGKSTTYNMSSPGDGGLVNGSSEERGAKQKTKTDYKSFLVSTGKAVFPQKQEEADGNFEDQNGKTKNAVSSDVVIVPDGKEDEETEVGEGENTTEHEGNENGAAARSGADWGNANSNNSNDNFEKSTTGQEDITPDGNVDSDGNITTNDDSTQDGGKTGKDAEIAKESGTLMPGNIEGDRPLSHPQEVTKYLRSVYKLVDTPKQLQTFSVCDEYIDTVSCVSGENAWMFCDGNRLLLVNKDGDKQRSIQLRGKIGDFCTLASGEVLLTHMDDCCVYSIQADGVMTLQFKTEPLHPVAIQPTNDNNLLVTMADVWDYKVEPHSQRLLRMYSRDGTVLKTLEFGPNEKRLFCKPGRVRVCKNNSNVAVCNFVNDKPGDDFVVFLDKDLNVLFCSNERYSVPDELKPQSHVIFDDMVFDSGDNIVTVETVSNSVQLLDKNCRYIKTLFRDPTGNEQPMSVALDTEGNLWIGFQRGHVTILKYRTQVLKVQEGKE
ncbi:LOW QUALITY PROTEIN: papilin-like [Argopecten irradians]|uniref:LOW QUALITY PROTEIN: papilin-like n=1 Tax=Argopecten irradians TaxID=31199 RepID=UPI00371E698F